LQVFPSHIIHRVNIDVQTNTMQTAENIQKNTDRFLQKTVLPAIEALLERKYKNVHLRLDKLDVEFNVKAIKDLQSKEIQEVMDEALAKILNEKQTHIAKETQKNETHNPTSWDVALHFLKFGSLPWYCSQQTKMQQVFNEVLEDLPNGHPKSKPYKGKILSKIAESIIQEPHFRERLLLQAPTLFLYELLELFSDKIITKKNIEAIVQLKTSIGKKPSSQLQQMLLLWAANNYLNQTLSEASLSMELRQIIHTLPQKLLQKEKQSLLVAVFNACYPSIKSLPIFKNLTFLRSKDSFVDWGLQLAGPLTNQLAEKPKALGDYKNTTVDQPQTRKQEAIIFAHAGLVLLHPYIPTFLEYIEVYNKTSKNISTEYYDLAAHALHFLATGIENSYESDMQFVKWLLNFPQNIIINRNYVLSKKVKTEANNLLSSALENWIALKSKSPDTLRGLFLDRKAKLIEDENADHLHFESMAQDLLLNQLPWAYSLVKLPWKQKLIQVIW